MRAEFITPARSPQTRTIWPEGADEPHARAVEMAEGMREMRGSRGNCSYADLFALGFTAAEIAEYEQTAIRLAAFGYDRQIALPGDRVPEIIEKAIAAAAHIMPQTAGLKTDDAMDIGWRRYCQARAAFKLDPWLSQGERCLALLGAFLRKLPLLPREQNRILYAVAAEQKATQMREGGRG